jgi:hypothetical protein
VFLSSRTGAVGLYGGHGGLRLVGGREYRGDGSWHHGLGAHGCAAGILERERATIEGVVMERSRLDAGGCSLRRRVVELPRGEEAAEDSGFSGWSLLPKRNRGGLIAMAVESREMAGAIASALGLIDGRLGRGRGGGGCRGSLLRAGEVRTGAWDEAGSLTRAEMRRRLSQSSDAPPASCAPNWTTRDARSLVQCMRLDMR